MFAPPSPAGPSAEAAPRLRQGLLATEVAGPEQRRLALAAIIVSGIAFAAAAPFAQVQLVPVTAFIPAYEAMLVLIDVITAVLLFGQFAQRRSAALLALAAGYLFDGLMVIPHALSFPGLLTPTGWLGAGAQTTAWLFMFWHGGFPLCVIAYAMLSHRGERQPLGAWPAVLASTILIIVSTMLTLVATNADTMLPAIMIGHGYTPVMKFVVGTVWGLSAIALLVLLWHRPYSILDLWLIVVMVAWCCDVALSAVLNAGRFDLGFYAGRAYGSAAASFVLAVLLVETGALQVQLAAATAQLEDYAGDLAHRVRERTAELARANRRLAAILDASPVAIVMLDPDGRVGLWNGSAERIFGYREAEALGRLPPYLGEDQIAEFTANAARAAGDIGAVGAHETRHHRKDGAPIEVSERWAQVNDDAGEMLGIIYTLADITERKKIEEHLRQAQKMEAVGNLTGGLAHDFNNLLGIITLNLDVLSERLQNDAEAAELTRDAMTAAFRGAELIRRLLAFARRQPLQPQRTDLNRLVSEITRLLARTLGEQVRIRLDLDDRLWSATIDPAQLEAALANLATNARDAMPNGGELTIVTGNRELDADYALQHSEVSPGHYAMIEVSDSGQGMPPEVASRVFEPFFTTKPAGKGTGLGLSMVFGFIKQSGGHINIYSEVGAGTTVRLYLRRAEEDLAADEPVAPAQLVRANGQTVLAVEDNQSLRRIVVRQLEELGYRPLEAEDAGAALRIIEDEPVALLFTDVVLPGGTNGYELARLATARRPGLKIVLTSGFPENRIAADRRSRNLTLLGKPYRKEDMARIIGNALAEGQG